MGNQSDFLTTMSRDEGDVEVVRKCCVIIGNIVTSGIRKYVKIYLILISKLGACHKLLQKRSQHMRFHIYAPSPLTPKNDVVNKTNIFEKKILKISSFS